ncbi:MOSC domain-containing protein [Tropicimonas marinistellae]|uniref:MOSC domain-containing protein n=1 Tax=Tropicimonas marinistellae TaxID=1739787 RepID=UPI000835FA39|nr:MOSC domain-containing protein [Tropicimonas marinistellae]
MAGRLAHIVRHPIKSLGWEELPAVELKAGQVLPFDRHWALAHEAAAFDGAPDGWYAKRNFVRGVAAPPLMAISATLSDDARSVRLSHPERPTLEVTPDNADASVGLVDWIAPLWPANRPAPARLVAAESQAMTDVPDPFVAVLNLASLRDLGQRMGKDLSIHRFRGNLWVDGFAEWEEFDWVGHEIRIGATRLRVEEPITRCNATKANPVTGQVDGDTLAALEAAFGHRDFGVYATVIEGGRVQHGDIAEAPL